MLCEKANILQIDSTQDSCNHLSGDEKCKYEHNFIAFLLTNFTFQLYLTTLHAIWKKAIVLPQKHHVSWNCKIGNLQKAQHTEVGAQREPTVAIACSYTGQCETPRHFYITNSLPVSPSVQFL